MTTYQARIYLYHPTVDIPNPVVQSSHLTQVLADLAISTFVTAFNLARSGTAMYALPNPGAVPTTTRIDAKQVVRMDTIVDVIP